MSEIATDPTQAPPLPPDAAAVVEEVVSTDPTLAASADIAATAAPTAVEATADATQDPMEVAEATPQGSELDAAIAATLAMDSEPSAVQSEEPVPTAEGTHQLVAGGGEPAEAERFSRDETGTPTLYSASASAGDIPGAVATPPLATAAAAVNGHGDESTEAQTQAAPAQGRTAAVAAATSSLSRVAQLTARIEKDPLDGQAQLALLHDAESKGDLERTREVYERFLFVFPDAVSLLTSAPHALGLARSRLAPSLCDAKLHPMPRLRETRSETRLTLERAAAVGRTMDQLLQPRTRPQSL